MSAKKWSYEEELMIKNGLTNGEIASLTGRTEKSVQMKRYRMTGLCDAPPREVEEVTEKKKKEYRILKIKMLAQKLGVKLFGKDE